MAEKDTKITFSALLESVDGLTDEFKAQAPKIFEEAVAARVEEAKAEVTAELTKSLEESFQAKLAEEVESAKSEAKKEAQKEALEESAQAFTAKIDELTAKNVELEESMKEAQAEADAKYNTLTENLHEVAKQLTEEAMGELGQKLDGWLEYCAHEYVEGHKPTMVQAEEVEIARKFMENIKGLMEGFNMANVEGAQVLKDQIADLEEENKNVYHELSESLARAQALEATIDSMKTTALVEGLKEGMTDTDKERFQVVVEALDLPFDQFETKAKELAESFKTAEPEVKVEDPKPTIVTESKVVETKQPEAKPKQEAIDADVAWVLASLQRHNA